MSDFLIRDATLADAPAIAQFQVEMARETEHRELDLVTVTAGATNVLKDSRFGHYLVAEDEEGAVIASLLLTFEWSDWRNGVFWWIQSVYVAPLQRRKGVFRALYQEVEMRAKNDGNVCGLRLYVERGNLKAQGVYAKLGMSETPYLVYETEF